MTFHDHETKVKITVHHSTIIDENNNDKIVQKYVNPSESNLLDDDYAADYSEDIDFNADLLMEQEMIEDEECTNENEEIEEEKYAGVNKSIAESDIDNADINTDKQNDVGVRRKQRTHHCKKCNASFRENHQLQKHQFVHTEERPFNCELCNKSFKAKDKLKIHQKSHSSDRPFKCEQCKGEFKLKSHLTRH